MAKYVKIDFDFENVARILNLPDPVSPQQPATRAYVDSVLEGLAWKDDVKVSSASNINLLAPGAAIDSVTMTASARFLARAQTDPTENGIYIWNGAATPATRAADATPGTELSAAIVTVREGTSAGVTYRQTTVDPVLGTDSVLWTSFGAAAAATSESTSGIAEIATQGETDAGTDDARFVTPLKLANWSGRIKKSSTTFGDGAATQYDISHNIATDVVVNVYRVSDGAEIICDILRLSSTTVRLKFAAAPPTNTLRCVVLG